MKSKAGVRHAGSVKILCADDDGSVLFGIARMLTNAGYAVTTAVDGLEAWSELEARHFDLLLTDFKMPRLNGAGLAIRARLKHLEMPIIVMSGAPRFEARFDCDLLRDITLIRKPFAPNELLDTINQVLSVTADTPEEISARIPKSSNRRTQREQR